MIALFYEQKELKEELYALWQGEFQDPDRFAAYYFEEIYKDNRVLVTQQEEEIVGMIHLNPYELLVNRHKTMAHYIVGVMSLPQYRRQGIMRNMLTKLLHDLAKEGELFTYLMPANQAYYLPFDFAVIYDRYEWNGNGNQPEPSEHSERLRHSKLPIHSQMDTCSYQIVSCKEEHIPQLAAFFAAYQESHYAVSAVRTIAYWERLIKELAAESGELMLLYQDKSHKELAGYYTYVQEPQINPDNLDSPISQEQQLHIHVREILLNQDAEPAMDAVFSAIESRWPQSKLTIWLEQSQHRGERRPMIMARLLRPDLILPLITGTNKAQIILEIQDPILAANNRTFLWELDQDGSQICDTSRQADLTVTIVDLTRLIFGYETQIKHPFFQAIHPLSPILLPEIV